MQALTAEKNRRLTENKLAYYKPYPKQIEFHASPARERLLMAGNQLGKTLAGGYEAAMHAAGIYPDFDAAARAMVAIERVVEPNPANAGVYDDLFGRYVDLYRRLNAS